MRAEREIQNKIKNKNTESKHKTADLGKQFTNLTKFTVLCRYVETKTAPHYEMTLLSMEMLLMWYYIPTSVFISLVFAEHISFFLLLPPACVFVAEVCIF